MWKEWKSEESEESEKSESKKEESQNRLYDNTWRKKKKKKGTKMFDHHKNI